MSSTARPSSKSKLTIVLIELPNTRIEAFYNPKDVTIKKNVPWSKHKSSKSDNPVLEFTNAEPKKMNFELFFDTYETGQNVYAEYIEKLEKATLIMGGKNEEKKRPPTCLISWGKGFPKFLGVMTSLSVKYTMFFKDGTPCRATATVEMTQATKTTKAEDPEIPIDDHSDRA